MSYVTGLMFLMIATCMPAMAWGLISDSKMPRWVNVSTFAVFVGPFALFMLLFIDGMTLRILEPLVIAWL